MTCGESDLEALIAPERRFGTVQRMVLVGRGGKGDYAYIWVSSCDMADKLALLHPTFTVHGTTAVLRHGRPSGKL